MLCWISHQRWINVSLSTNRFFLRLSRDTFKWWAWGQPAYFYLQYEFQVNELVRQRTIYDHELVFKIPAGNHATADVSCSSTYMPRIRPRLERQPTQQMAFLPWDKTCYLLMEVNIQYLDIWMPMQSKVKKQHFNTAIVADTLAASVNEVWQHLLSQKVIKVFSWIPTAIQRNVDVQWRNNSVVMRQGKIVVVNWQ